MNRKERRRLKFQGISDVIELTSEMMITEDSTISSQDLEKDMEISDSNISQASLKPLLDYEDLGIEFTVGNGKPCCGNCSFCELSVEAFLTKKIIPSKYCDQDNETKKFSINRAIMYPWVEPS